MLERMTLEVSHRLCVEAILSHHLYTILMTVDGSEYCPLQTIRSWALSTTLLSHTHHFQWREPTKPHPPIFLTMHTLTGERLANFLDIMSTAMVSYTKIQLCYYSVKPFVCFDIKWYDMLSQCDFLCMVSWATSRDVEYSVGHRKLAFVLFWHAYLHRFFQ